MPFPFSPDDADESVTADDLAAGITLQHTYETPGEYPISIIGYTSAGEAVTLVVDYAQILDPYVAPTLRLEATPLGLSVLVLPVYTAWGDRAASLTLAWGDGTTADAAPNTPIAHTYAAPGCYHLTAEAIDIFDAVASATTQVRVAPLQDTVTLQLDAFAGETLTVRPRADGAQRVVVHIGEEIVPAQSDTPLTVPWAPGSALTLTADATFADERRAHSAHLSLIASGTGAAVIAYPSGWRTLTIHAPTRTRDDHTITAVRARAGDDAWVAGVPGDPLTLTLPAGDTIVSVECTAAAESTTIGFRASGELAPPVAEIVAVGADDLLALCAVRALATAVPLAACAVVWGDGAESAAAIDGSPAAHAYASAGQYLVHARVTDTAGASYRTDPVTITLPDPVAFTARDLD